MSEKSHNEKTLSFVQQVHIADLYNTLGIPLDKRECPSDFIEKQILIMRLTSLVEEME